MVTPITPQAGPESWWDYTTPLVVGEDGVLETHGEDVAISVGTFYVLEGGSCPNLEATPFFSDSDSAKDALAAAENAAAAAVEDEIKSDSPVGSAVQRATPLLTGQAGARYLILVLYGFPDGCSGVDAPQCFVDETLKTIQDARQLGITTIPIVLNGPSVGGATNYAWYAQALANAGAGLPVGLLDDALTPTEGCPASSPTADYSGTAGSTRPHSIAERDETALKTALKEIFDRIRSCE